MYIAYDNKSGVVYAKLCISKRTGKIITKSLFSILSNSSFLDIIWQKEELKNISDCEKPPVRYSNTSLIKSEGVFISRFLSKTFVAMLARNLLEVD